MNRYLAAQIAKKKSIPFPYVKIGDQFWSRQNLNITSINGISIPEVQGNSTDANPELMSPINFSLSSWIITGAAIKIDSDSFLTTGDGGLRRAILTVGKVYILSFSISTTAVVSKVYNSAGSPLNEIKSGVPFVAIDSSIYFRNTGAGTTDITVNLLKEVGWVDLTTPAYSYYGNNPANGDIYGKMYNGYAAEMINANINASYPGWRLPTYAEITTLVNYCGGESVAGGKLKSLTLWNAPNSGASDEFGFKFLGGGFRDSATGSFFAINSISNIWASDGSPVNLYRLRCDYNLESVYMTGINKGNGAYIRLIRK